MHANDDDLLAIHVSQVDGVAVLACRGQIDTVTAPLLRESVQRACELGVPVVIDMELVTFMDSSGVSALVEASGVADGRPCSVQIHQATDDVQRLLQLTGLDGIFLPEP